MQNWHSAHKARAMVARAMVARPMVARAMVAKADLIKHVVDESVYLEESDSNGHLDLYIAALLAVHAGSDHIVDHCDEREASVE